MKFGEIDKSPQAFLWNLHKGPHGGSRNGFTDSNKRMTKKITGMTPEKPGKTEKISPFFIAEINRKKGEKGRKIDRFCGKIKKSKKIIAKNRRTNGRQNMSFFQPAKEKGCKSVSNRLQWRRFQAGMGAGE